MLNINLNIAAALLVVGLNLTACQSYEATQIEDTAQQIYLVRHAEKILDVEDPALTSKGQERAQALAVRLDGITIDIDGIYSSDYRRTRDTAAPLAASKGLEVQLYDPRDLPALAQRLKATCKVCVVVGHSNTTPQLSVELGGKSGGEINEASEYDRLYLIVINRKDGEDGEDVSTLIESYGAP
ncbi:phosphoglycerate mutase family protein [Robiginitomaculum antarcticum]|uniref:phosphoglycerate mutase family protein n=1 Tax=Robiginitomaculum antarcticum TaxID=437507 RepID=UPI0003797D63|nr:phosphoglycerate mutase family protein [Robiginitomaculum antarcticum]